MKRMIFIWLLIAALLCLGAVLPASAGTVTHSYDKIGRLIGVQYDNGQTITYSYDAAGNVLTREVVTALPLDPLTDFVTRFYRLILGREPDSAGLKGWVDDLLSGRSAGCDIAFGFVFSPEFINRNTSDEAYVDILYRAFFNREADIAGKNGWLNALQSGVSRRDVLDGFLFSQEFANLAASFGITACAP